MTSVIMVFVNISKNFHILILRCMCVRDLLKNYNLHAYHHHHHPKQNKTIDFIRVGNQPLTTREKKLCHKNQMKFPIEFCYYIE